MGSETTKRRYRAYVMFMLVTVYTFNFIDRQIVSILAVPIKADLGLSDTQLGLMGGLAFALFYTALGIPVAMLADRRSRTWIMTIALTFWSAMTAACGLAQNFWQLFVARLGVGVGEAGGVAPAYSLIADYFPSEQRARAMSVYSFGIPVGSALGILLGGFLASRVDWRYAFFVVGIAGVVFAPLFRATVKEPVRGQQEAGSGGVSAESLAEVRRLLSTKTSFWFISLAAAVASMAGYGILFWLPSFFVRSFGLGLFDASLLFGGLYLVAGMAGLWFGGSIADRLGATSRAAYARIPAAALTASVPFFAAAMLSTDLFLTVAMLFLPIALGLVWLGPVMSAVQHLVPPGMRATASAICLFVINLIGLGGGTLAIGAVSDLLQDSLGANALKYSIVASTGFYLIAAVIFLLAARRLERDWADQDQPADSIA